MEEKKQDLLSEDIGNDIASVQTLQRKHDVVERDLAALEEKVQSHMKIYCDISV